MSVKVKLEFNHLPKIAAGLRSKAEAMVAKAALDVEGWAKSMAPVDTGNLRNSITASHIGPMRWSVAVGAEYGPYVEFGTRFMPAQPFLLPALGRVAPSLSAALGSLVRP